ncbi:MAG TPA: FtsX-like permease family protein [Candidatus Mediterraneibacter cottocaccae]|nr:FtsX-like permease family protein [Candidatus Mediterraneibacter cottocaccae]
MDVCRRAALYLMRRKGKALLLFLVFFFISALLMVCSSVLDGTGQAAENLRSNIGAAFYIRPYAKMTMENGEISQSDVTGISRQSIEEVTGAAQGQVKTYNTEHYGYARSRQIHFLPGAGDSEESNMGQVTAVRDSRLTEVFLNGEYTLTVGRHIGPEDENKILISAELAAENDLKVGDVLTLTHAGLDRREGEYIDTVPEKTAFAEAEIVGIFQCDGKSDSADTPTAGKAANHIYSDRHLLVNLQEQQEGVFDGEVAFFIADPLKLDALIEHVEAIDSIDWENHILRKNDFQYGQIAGQLQNLQRLAAGLIAVGSASGIVILMLILTLQMRGRTREAGIYLSAGISKAEITGQFILEAWLLLTTGFLAAFLMWQMCSGMVNEILSGTLAQEADAVAQQTEDAGTVAQQALRGGGSREYYMQTDFLHLGMLFAGEFLGVLLTVLASCSAILRLKPKEILIKLS